MATCGGQSASSKTYDLRFVTNNGRGNGLDSGGGSTISCYTPVTATYETVTRDVYLFGSGKSPVDKSAYVSVSYRIQTGTTGGQQWSYQFSNFIINIEAKLDVFYRTVNGKNHLIVRARDLWSYLVGPTQNIYSNFNAGLYVGGNISYALAASTVPAAPVENSPAWRKCLGGWWSAAPTTPCGSGSCYGAPGGGTIYTWGRNQKWGSKFEHRGTTPARMDGAVEWDLGEIKDYNNTNIYIYGRMMQGGNNSCAGAYFRGRTSYQAAVYAVPPVDVCPPELIGITQERDICGNCAFATFDFAPNDFIGYNQGTIQIDYVYNPKDGVEIDWTKAETSFLVVDKNTNIHMELPCLVSGSKYCWRAKAIAGDNGFKAESKYIYGCFDTLYIPESTWVVPDITDAECEIISRGGYVEQFEEKP